MSRSMSGVRYAAVWLCAVAMMLAGCGERQPTQVDTVEDYIETPAPPEPPAEEEAREIVAKATRVREEDVRVVDQAASGDVLTINATIPAHERMLPHHAAAPDVPDGAETEQIIEWVKVRWDTAADRPIDITWPERLQFAEEEPISEEQALEAAESLKDAWFPEVPAEMVMQPPRLLNRPVWAITWRGQTEDDVLTGDQIAVQVSALTGLPIAYSQRVAVKRPSPDEVEVTRAEAIEAVREALAEEGVEEATDMRLVARLVLSAPQHPEGGPAWLVRGTGDDELLMVPVDAMSGEVLGEDGDSAESRSTTSGRGRPDSGQ